MVDCILEEMVYALFSLELQYRVYRVPAWCLGCHGFEFRFFSLSLGT